MAQTENVANAGQVKGSCFHPFFLDAPEMRIPASDENVTSFLASGKQPFYLFAVPREYPVSDYNKIPEILLKNGFRFTANPGEFFVFQIALWTPGQGLGDIRLQAEDVPFSWRCFNLRPGKRMNQMAHSVRPLWIGLEIPASASGKYSLRFRLETENFPSQTVDVPLVVEGPVLKDGCESDD